MTNKRYKNWLVPGLLLLLGSINVISGAFQLDTIMQGPPAVPDEMMTMEYFSMPVPIVLHILAGVIFNLMGPLQFAPITWGRWAGWHRWSGRLLVLSGFLIAGTGLWMNHVYPQYGGLFKYPGIVVNSLGLAVALGIALQAVRSSDRDIAKHRKWMMRAVAFGLGPATQRVVIIPYFLIFGIPDDWMIGLVIWMGFLINLAVVEFVLARNRRGRQSSANLTLKTLLDKKV